MVKVYFKSFAFNWVAVHEQMIILWSNFLFFRCGKIVFKIKSSKKKKFNLFNEHHTFESDFKLSFTPVAPIWMHTMNTVYVIFL